MQIKPFVVKEAVPSVPSEEISTVKMPRENRMRVVSPLTLTIAFTLFLLLVLEAAALAQAGMITNLRMTDLHLSPKTIQVTWQKPPPCTVPSSPGPSDMDTDTGCIDWDDLHRSPGFVTTTTSNPTLVGSEYVYNDTNWNFNTRYTYSLIISYNAYHWTHPTATTTGGWSYVTTYSTESIHVTVRKILASVNQTADTRLDMRFGDPTLKDYQFKDNKWRGGLFAGFNADNSKVSRTYFKFTSLLGPISTGEQLWPHGGLAMYCTRLASTGSVSLQCRTGLSDTWDATTLNWSNAPAPKTSGGPAFSISWDKTNHFGAPGDPYSPPATTDPTGKWFVINFLPDISDALAASSTTLTAIVQSPSEASTYSGAPDHTGGGWAYFAKNGYGEPNQPTGETDLTAYLLYAFGGSGVSYDDPGDGGGDGGGGDGPEGFGFKKKKGKAVPPASQPKTPAQGSKGATAPVGTPGGKR